MTVSPTSASARLTRHGYPGFSSTIIRRAPTASSSASLALAAGQNQGAREKEEGQRRLLHHGPPGEAGPSARYSRHDSASASRPGALRPIDPS
jgi:hypothetical protein